MSPSRTSAAVVVVVIFFHEGVNAQAVEVEGLDPEVSAAPPPTWPSVDPFSTRTHAVRSGPASPAPRLSQRIDAVRDVIGFSYYTDDHHSHVDPALKQRNEAAMRPLHDFLSQVVNLADSWGARGQPAEAGAAMELLNGWAQSQALLGTVNQQGAYERVWTLSGLALAYLRVRAAPRVDHGERETIETWFDRLGRAIIDEFPKRGPVSRLNNHACWAALAVAAAGIAARDRDLFRWSTSTARTALAQTREDGFLPLELQRGARAFHYHVFALAPLVMLAELAIVNRVNLYEDADGAIGRLANRVIDGWRNPAVFVAQAGIKQEMRPPRGADLAWAEPYFARFHDRRLAPLLAAARPLRDDRLGGDLTAAFGAPDLK
jgi:poly(beta-D-mannuronate) lyase